MLCAKLKFPRLSVRMCGQSFLVTFSLSPYFHFSHYYALIELEIPSFSFLVAHARRVSGFPKYMAVHQDTIWGSSPSLSFAFISRKLSMTSRERRISYIILARSRPLIFLTHCLMFFHMNSTFIESRMFFLSLNPLPFSLEDSILLCPSS